MGQMARLNRCSLFIEEFNKDYQKIFGSAGTFKILNHTLSTGDDECVHFFFQVRDQEGREMSLHLEGKIYDPEDTNPEDTNPGIAHFGRRLAQKGLIIGK